MVWKLFKTPVKATPLFLFRMRSILTFPCPGTLVPGRTHPRHTFGSMVATGSKAPIWTMIHRCLEPEVSGEITVSYTGKKIND